MSETQGIIYPENNALSWCKYLKAEKLTVSKEQCFGKYRIQSKSKRENSKEEMGQFVEISLRPKREIQFDFPVEE